MLNDKKMLTDGCRVTEPNIQLRVKGLISSHAMYYFRAITMALLVSAKRTGYVTRWLKNIA
jgi:hypothetical protein